MPQKGNEEGHSLKGGAGIGIRGMERTGINVREKGRKDGGMVWWSRGGEARVLKSIGEEEKKGRLQGRGRKTVAAVAY